MPYLEFLEMGSINPELRDDRLIRLLNTRSFIRKKKLDYYSWQTGDVVRAAREKRRKDKRAADTSAGNTSDSDDVSSERVRCWLPGGGRSSGNISLTVLETETNVAAMHSSPRKRFDG